MDDSESDSHKRLLRLTVLWNKHNQVCPYCTYNLYDKVEKVSLYVLEDWFGGGSHYWNLQCVLCEKVFEYGTYDFKLREYDLKTQKRI